MGSCEGTNDEGELLRLEVLGRRAGFRRLEFIRFEDDEIDGLCPSPGLEVILDVDLQCAQVVRYEHHLLCQSAYWCTSNEPHLTGDRLINALVRAFLVEQARLMVRWGVDSAEQTHL